MAKKQLKKEQGYTGLYRVYTGVIQGCKRRSRSRTINQVNQGQSTRSTRTNQPGPVNQDQSTRSSQPGPVNQVQSGRSTRFSQAGQPGSVSQAQSGQYGLSQVSTGSVRSVRARSFGHAHSGMLSRARSVGHAQSGTLRDVSQRRFSEDSCNNVLRQKRPKTQVTQR